MSLLDHLSGRLAAIAAQGQTRSLRRADGGTAPRQAIDGRELLMFCANDYLGLAAEPAIAEALAEGARRWGGGSGASPLVSGHSAAHQAVADKLAGWYAPHIPQARVLGFCTGYMANLAVVATLGDEHAEIFSEQLNHASLIDAARLARARVVRFPHADLSALRAALAASTARIKLVVTDAVFSMDGDVADVAALLALCERFDALLLLDDSHGFGILGPQGRGVLAEAGLGGRQASPRVLYMASLGKAAGGAGGFVAGSDVLIEWLLQKTRSYIFATAAPALLARALQAGLDQIERGSALRARLQERIAQLQDGVARVLRGSHWRLGSSRTAIQPLLIGANDEALAVMEGLRERGIWVPAIRPPTVPEGTARLRIALSAAHTPADIDRLISALAELAPATNPHTHHPKAFA